MKNVFLLLSFFFIVLLACNKEPEIVLTTSERGKSVAEKTSDGVTEVWQTEVRMSMNTENFHSNNRNNVGFRLNLSTKFDKNLLNSDYFYFNAIPLKLGTYKISEDWQSSEPNLTYYASKHRGYSDVHSFNLDPAFQNELTITSIDAIGKEVSGTFNLHFLSLGQDPIFGGYPSKVSFSKGRFKVKI
ncbi:MAG: hypothetical protein RLZZ292_3670 [Bacteroidota bacterium]|jgi:hypothetical protein